MDILIFKLLLVLLGANALFFPLVALGELMWSFVNRADMTDWAQWWQAFKYDWYEEADDWGEEILRWIMCDIVMAFIILFACALLGSVGLLTWLVGIPLVVLAAMYGVRYFLDNFND